MSSLDGSSTSDAPREPARGAAAQPAAEASTAVGVGVDLGTTACRAAVVRDGGAEPLSFTTSGPPMAELPASLRLPGEETEPAATEATTGPPTAAPERAHLVVSHVTRLLAVPMGELERRRLSLSVGAPVAADERGEAGVRTPGGSVSGRSLTSALLAATRRQGLDPAGAGARAVLAVPCWFGERRRTALRGSAREAGIDVQRLVSAPAAAALAFAAGRGLARRRLLVVDLGAGGASCSLLEVTGGDVTTVACAGDERLGGLDFDLAFAEVLTESLPESLGAALAQGEPPALLEGLLHAAQRTKHALSTELVASVDVPTEPRRAGRPAQARRVDALRSRWETQTAPLRRGVLELTRTLLRDAAVEPRSLDDVLLLGGQSAVPSLRAGLGELLGRPVAPAVAPPQAVARGAALVAEGLARRAKGRRGAQVLEALVAPIGLAVAGGGTHRLFERWARLPARARVGWPARAGGRFRVALLELAADASSAPQPLGWLEVAAAREGDVALDVELDGDGCLAVIAALPGERPRRLELLRREPTLPAADEPGLGLPPLPPWPPVASPRRQPPLLERLRRILAGR